MSHEVSWTVMKQNYSFTDRIRTNDSFDYYQWLKAEENAENILGYTNQFLQSLFQPSSAQVCSTLLLLLYLEMNAWLQSLFHWHSFLSENDWYLFLNLWLYTLHQQFFSTLSRSLMSQQWVQAFNVYSDSCSPDCYRRISNIEKWINFHLSFYFLGAFGLYYMPLLTIIGAFGLYCTPWVTTITDQINSGIIILPSSFKEFNMSFILTTIPTSFCFWHLGHSHTRPHLSSPRKSCSLCRSSH